MGDTSALQDAKAFQKGKGKMLVAMVALVCGALGAFALYLLSKQPNPYSGLGRQVNGFRGELFDGFWSCALPGKVLSDIKSDADLRAELHERGAAGVRYADHLTGDCLGLLSELKGRLGALLPPDPAKPHLAAMGEGIDKMIAGVSRYTDHLRSSDGAYSPEPAEAELEELVRGWYEFRKSHAELNGLVKRELGR